MSDWQTQLRFDPLKPLLASNDTVLRYWVRRELLDVKIALVYLHKEGRFEAWLAGNNRQVRAEYVEALRHRDLHTYVLSQIQPGVDSIVASDILGRLDFDDLDGLPTHVEAGVMRFAEDLTCALDSEGARS